MFFNFKVSFNKHVEVGVIHRKHRDNSCMLNIEYMHPFYIFLKEF